MGHTGRKILPHPFQKVCFYFLLFFPILTTGTFLWFYTFSNLRKETIPVVRYADQPAWTISVLRSRNYLFSAPAPPLSIISAAPTPAPAPAIYCHLKLYYYNSRSILATSKLTEVSIYLKDNFGSRSQIIFCLHADPDPHPICGSGSSRSPIMRIRIHITALLFNTITYLCKLWDNITFYSPVKTKKSSFVCS